MQLINPPHTPEVSQDFPLGQLESVSHSSKIDIKIDKIYLIQTLNLNNYFTNNFNKQSECTWHNIACPV